MRGLPFIGLICLALPALAEGPVELDRAEQDLEAEEAAHEVFADPVVYATAYIRSFHESVCAGLPGRDRCLRAIEATGRWKAAPDYAEAIVEAADGAGVPWAVLLVIARYESSYDPSAVGGKGERGLVQVHGEAAAGHDLTTPAGQLAAGAGWYAHCLERCGDRLGALRAYQSGSCRKDIDGARVRFNEIARVEADVAGPVVDDI